MHVTFFTVFFSLVMASLEVFQIKKSFVNQSFEGARTMHLDEYRGAVILNDLSVQQ